MFRFTGLSNQIQPREMYEKWRTALDIDNLFDDLKDELAAATQFLMSKEQIQRAETANNLSTIAAIGVVLGLAFSFLGMNVVMGSDTIRGILFINDKTGVWIRLLRELVPAGLVVAVASSIGLFISHRLAPVGDDQARRVTRTALRWAAWIGISSVLAGLLGFLFR